MNPFSPEQINMICIYAEENRSDVIDNLRQMLNYLAYDEYELRNQGKESDRGQHILHPSYPPTYQ